MNWKAKFVHEEIIRKNNEKRCNLCKIKFGIYSEHIFEISLKANWRCRKFIGMAFLWCRGVRNSPAALHWKVLGKICFSYRTQKAFQFYSFSELSSNFMTATPHFNIFNISFLYFIFQKNLFPFSFHFQLFILSFTCTFSYLVYFWILCILNSMIVLFACELNCAWHASWCYKC